MDWVAFVFGVIMGSILCIALFSFLLIKFWAACARTEIKETPYAKPSLAHVSF
jgi:hypothetical protein